MALTKRQKKYAERRAAGDSYSKAYKAAGYSDRQSTRTATNNAYALEHTSASSNEILSKIKDLQARAERGAILDRQQRQAELTALALDKDAARADRIRAIDLLNKMSGDYSERVIYEGTAHVSIEDARRQAWDELRS